MKKFFICCFLLFFICCSVYAQVLIVKGNVRCMNQSINSTKGAENIIVVPTFMPSHATITASRPLGYFEFNTGLPLLKLQDKIINIYVVSRCTGCKEAMRRVFISEDQDRRNKNDNKSYVTIKDWKLNANCKQAELPAFSADSILQIIVKQPAQELDNISNATALVGAPTFLNFLNTLAPAVGALTGFGNYKIDSLGTGKINYGNFLFASPLTHSANTGFNFSPSRDMGEAMFWNPSAIGFSKKPHNISLLTNVKNNVRLGGFYRINEKFSLGGGVVYTMQDEFRRIFFKNTASANGDKQKIDSTVMKLKEYAAFISPVFKVNNNFSLGLTIKSLWQDVNIPNTLNFNSSSQGVVTDTSIKKQHFDVDISATIKVSTALQIGINLMNLAGTELYADAFVPGQSKIPANKQRAICLGLVYKWQRFNFGTDIVITADKFYDASLGVNYVPFNNALLSAGIAFKQLSYSFAFRIKHFRIAYINDNDWLINEQRKGKAAILNGKIYGGFVFDFN
jgi:hypothetical protein